MGFNIVQHFVLVQSLDTGKKDPHSGVSLRRYVAHRWTMTTPALLCPHEYCLQNTSTKVVKTGKTKGRPDGVKHPVSSVISSFN